MQYTPHTKTNKYNKKWFCAVVIVDASVEKEFGAKSHNSEDVSTSSDHPEHCTTNNKTTKHNASSGQALIQTSRYTTHNKQYFRETCFALFVVSLGGKGLPRRPRYCTKVGVHSSGTAIQQHKLFQLLLLTAKLKKDFWIMHMKKTHKR